MNSFTECLKQIASLTKKNLQILRMLNDSFYTKKNHLISIVDGEQYVIPSFLSLESKIDNIEASLQNILDAPKTGEAFTYFDGTTQKIELAGYSTVPPKVDLEVPDKFTASINHIFKDFMTPQPSVRFDIGEIANNIKHVIVKKVSIKNPALLSLVQSNVSDPIQDENGNILRGNIGYGDLVKTLFNYDEGIGYEEYDTVKRLPIRMNNPSGEYDILEIVDTWQDSNFEEHYILRVDKDLVYYIQNGTIQKNIMVGDYLVTHNDKVEMIVEEANPVNRTLTVKILHGAYAELYDKSTGNIGMYRLKYHKVNDQLFSSTKYTEVPLEEDSYVCIFIAPINDTTNTQAAYGSGVFLYTDKLLNSDDNTEDFRTYYTKNVNNIGDALYAITNMMNDDDQVEKLTGDQFIELIQTKPAIDTEDISIYQINKHLNDSESVQKIRNLYSQKVKYKNDLTELETQIGNINEILADSSFDDTDETREAYKAQLRELNAQRRELAQNVTSIVQEISENANSSDTPIENAKYHIRGFIKTDITGNAKVVGLDVEYRYKNKNKFTGNAETIGESYIFSDWNKMDGFMNAKIPQYNINTGRYSYEWEPNNESVNEPSYNQIDIPITQGENVDIRVRFIYNLGWPLVMFRSDWSDIFNIEFPEEFVKDVEILDIIAENNDDIKKNQFLGILEKEGVISHVQDYIQDMDIKYFHQPEHIASGFYTPERRIIPLSDQLMIMARTLSDLQSEINGATASLQITLTDGIQETNILPDIVNNFRAQSFVDAVNEGNYQQMILDRDKSQGQQGVATDELVTIPMAVSSLVLNIYNPTEYTIKIHSLFPGDPGIVLDDSASSNRFGYQNYTGGGYCSSQDTDPVSTNIDGYSYESDEGVWMLLSGMTGQSRTMQRQNQLLYFRTQVDGKSLYTVGTFDGTLCSVNQQSVDNDNFNGKYPNNLLSAHKDCIYELEPELKYMFDESGNKYKGLASLYPHIGKIEDIAVDPGSSYYELKSGESIQVPLDFVYWLSSNDGVLVQASGDAGSNNPADVNILNKHRPFDNRISRAIAFDIRTSLFADPVTYKIVVEAHYQDLQTFKNLTVNKDSIKTQYSPSTIVNSGKKRR